MGTQNETVGIKRIHIEGLTANVTEQEIREKFCNFGKVHDVEIKIKKNVDGDEFNTFAFVNLDADFSSLQRCFSIFNKAKWKGRTLNVQVAKQHFLTRLEKERSTPEVPKIKKVRTNFHNPIANMPDAVDFNVKGKVPGTAIPGEAKWIVGKYGRVLPIVDVRNRSINKVLHVDPSKFCHNVKKIKPDEDLEDNLDVGKLTWIMNGEETEKSRRRRGDFSDYEDYKEKIAKLSKPNNWSDEMEEKLEELRRRYINGHIGQQSKEENIELEVVTLKGEKKISDYYIPKEDFIYDSGTELGDRDDEVEGMESDSGDSVGSADTDEIIAMMNSSKQTNTHVDTKASEIPSEEVDIPKEHENGSVATESNKIDAQNGSVPTESKKTDAPLATPILCYVDNAMKMTPFKGMCMLDSDNESIPNISTEKTSNITDESSVSIDNNTNQLDTTDNKTTTVNSSELDNESESETYDCASDSSDASDASDASDETEPQKTKSKTKKMQKMKNNLSLNQSSSEDESHSSMSDNFANKTSNTNSDLTNAGVSSVVSRKEGISSADDKSNVTQCSRLSESKMDTHKTNPISTCSVLQAQSDSEYDTDDFEKVVQKFENKLETPNNNTNKCQEKTKTSKDVGNKESSETESEVSGSKASSDEPEVSGSKATSDESEVSGGSKASSDESEVSGSKASSDESEVSGSKASSDESEVSGSKASSDESEVSGSKASSDESEVSESEVSGSKATRDDVDSSSSSDASSGSFSEDNDQEQLNVDAKLDIEDDTDYEDFASVTEDIVRYDPLNEDHNELELQVVSDSQENKTEEVVEDGDSESTSRKKERMKKKKVVVKEDSKEDSDEDDCEGEDSDDKDSNDNNSGEDKEDNEEDDSDEDEDESEEDDSDKEESDEEESDEDDTDKEESEKEDSEEENVKKEKNKKKKKKVTITEDIQQEKFFLSSSLLNTFSKKTEERSTGSGFSFLQSLGRTDINETSTEEPQAYKLPWQLKPQSTVREQKADEEKKKKISSKSDGPLPTFFFEPNDVRLKEGIEFFHRKVDPDVIEEMWQEERPLFLANCRQRNRLALRRINQEKLKNRKKPYSSTLKGKKNERKS